MNTNKDEIVEQINKPPSQSTKDELIITVKEWIKMDNDITKLKLETKEKTNKKK